jgi:hypothetical protein
MCFSLVSNRPFEATTDLTPTWCHRGNVHRLKYNTLVLQPNEEQITPEKVVTVPVTGQHRVLVPSPLSSHPLATNKTAQSTSKFTQLLQAAGVLVRNENNTQ